MAAPFEHDFAASVDFLVHFAHEGESWTLVAIEPDPPEGQLPRAPGATFDSSTAIEARAWLERHKSWNLYFTVNVARVDVRTTPTKEQITGFRCIHVDVDLPRGTRASEAEFARMLARLRSCVPAPTMIIFSGGGFQAIWRFPENLPPSELLRVEATCRELTERLAGADHCWNANRLLRLPGTVNWLNRAKRARGREPAMAYLVEADWGRTWSYAAGDPVPAPGLEPEEDEPTVAPLEHGRAQDEHDVEDLPPRLRKIIVTGDATRWGGDRSRAVYFVCCSLVRLHWPDATILGVLTEPRYLLSAHVREQSRPDAYARRQLTDAHRDVAADWERTPAGALRNSQTNIRRALSEMTVAMSYNEFSGRAWVNGAGPMRLWTDDVEIQVQLEVDRRFGFLPDTNLFRMVTRDMSLSAPFHPIRARLAKLEPTWDGVPRVEEWLIRCADAEDTPYTRAVSRITLVAAVRRVREPGVKFDEMLVLVDPQQGTDKSTALRHLALEDAWFTDSVPLGSDPRKVIERTRGKWICEASDLAGMSKSHVAEIKDFLSRQSDLARLVWDHHPTEVLRQWLIMGSTNELSFLKDDQNRRFWPVRTHRFDVELLLSIREQLWAEAATLESAGESIRLDRSLWQAAAEVQTAARAPEPWAEVFAEYLGDMTGRISAFDAWKILDKPPGQRQHEDNRRFGNAMRELGWERSFQRFGPGSGPKGCYLKGTPEERQRIIYVLRDPITKQLEIGHNPPDFTQAKAAINPEHEREPY